MYENGCNFRGSTIWILLFGHIDYSRFKKLGPVLRRDERRSSPGEDPRDKMSAGFKFVGTSSASKQAAVSSNFGMVKLLRGANSRL